MNRAVYFEHRRIGRQVKVTAIDSLTGFEISVFGPIDSLRALEGIALAKLRKRLAASAHPLPEDERE